MIKVTLNPKGVSAPAFRAMRCNCEIIAISLHALENTDFANLPAVPGSFFQWRFDESSESPEIQKALYRNWLLSKGFQDIARGVRETLEEAYLYIQLVKTIPNNSRYGYIAEVRQRANKMNFPDLLRSVNNGLTKALSFESEFQSLQRVRNCLEHRNGIVAKQT